MTINASGLGIRGTSIGYAFTVRNWKNNEAASSVSFQIGFIDPGGRVLATDQLSVPFLGPNEETDLAGVITSSAVARDSRMTVQPVVGNWVASGYFRGLYADSFKWAYVEDQSGAKITGTIVNPLAKDCRGVRVNAVGVDDSGFIVGAGIAYLDVPALQTVPAAVPYVGPSPSHVGIFVSQFSCY